MLFRRMNFICRLFCFAVLLVIVVSCGDEKTTEVKVPEDVSADIVNYVKEIKNLPQCTKDRFGLIYYVTKRDSFYECSSMGWESVDSAYVQDVRDNQDSLECDSCSELKTISASSSELEKIELKKVENVKLSGFAQKGPFVEGTEVLVFGVDKKLNKTKKKYLGKIEGGKGAYTISEISLDNQYALVEIQGFFQNEITGAITNGKEISLHALVDLSKGGEIVANVNVLTELELERVRFLVNEMGFNVPAAKKRATKEILELMGAVNLEENLRSVVATDISLADTTTAGAVLYAASVIFLSDLSLSRFETRLANLVEEFRQSGTWNDFAERVEIADYINDVCNGEFYENLREALMKMKLSKKIPNFENVLGNFMGREYGFETCSSTNEKKIAKNVNKQSDFYGADFVCADRRWHMISAMDKEFGFCTSKMEGEFTKSGEDRFYVCKDGDWKKIDECTYELKACTRERDGEYKSFGGEFFHCKDLQWERIDAIVYELEECTDERENEVARTEFSGYFACKEREWVLASWEDYEIGKICDGSIKDSMAIMDGVGYYYCDGEKWFEISKDLFDVGLCTKERVGTCAVTENGVYYKCYGEDLFDWYEESDLNCNIGDCSEENENKNVVYDGYGYFCKDFEWVECGFYNENRVENGMACVVSKADSSETNYVWRDATEYEIRTSKVCNGDDVEETVYDWYYDDKYESAIYCIDECVQIECEDGVSRYNWVEASDVDIKTRERCKFENLLDSKAGYVCDLNQDGRFVWVKKK